jgi:hypothetical protein
MIRYKGTKYPTRSFQVSSKETGKMDITISTVSLEAQIMDDGVPHSSLEEDIDSDIYFYLDDELMNLPAKTICKEHLDIPFRLIEEY